MIIFSEEQKSNGTKYIFWSSLDNLAEHEGNSVGDYSEKTLEECHDLCNDNDRCNSIAFKDGSCHLKDKCIDPSESQKFVEGWKTYYKECNGKISNVLFGYFHFKFQIKITKKWFLYFNTFLYL